MVPVKDLLPFVLALAALLAQPIFDKAWEAHFEKLYAAEDESLVGAAAWIASLAAFVPSAVLTLYGVLLFVITEDPKGQGWIALGLLTAVVVSFALYIYESNRGVPEKQPRLKHYDYLQGWLAALNIGGIVVVCAL